MILKEAYDAGYRAALIAQGLKKKELEIQNKLAKTKPKDEQPETTRTEPFYLSTWSEV